MLNFWQTCLFLGYLSSPIWAALLPVISQNILYQRISYGVCFLLFAWPWIQERLFSQNHDVGGLAVLAIMLSINALALTVSGILAIVFRRDKRLFTFYAVMVGSAVLGFLMWIVLGLC